MDRALGNPFIGGFKALQMWPVTPSIKHFMISQIIYKLYKNCF